MLARSGGHGARAGGNGREADGLDLADGQPDQRKLLRDARARPADQQRAWRGRPARLRRPRRQSARPICPITTPPIPKARQFIWDTVKKNYYDQGVRLWWLDNDEPDVNPWHPENLRFYLGNGVEVANIYPLLHQQAFYDGMRAAGETEIVTLSRSGWAGSQRFSSVIWSGDIASTFEALQAQVRAGLNMAMSGIPWWTTDIGGFHGGDIHSDVFPRADRALVPVRRLLPDLPPARPSSAAPTNPCRAAARTMRCGRSARRPTRILRDCCSCASGCARISRSRCRSPARQVSRRCARCSSIFPTTRCAETIDDQFMFGPEILVAPVLDEGARERQVYLPAGADWLDVGNGHCYTLEDNGLTPLLRWR